MHEKAHRFVTAASAVDSPKSVLDGIKPLETRNENGQYSVNLELPKGAVARVSFLFKQRGIKGQLCVDGKPVEADRPHIRLADSKGRSSGLRAGARHWSLFGVEITPGKHAVRFTPQGRSTDEGVLVVADLRAAIAATRPPKIKHASVKREDRPQLPQNWSWQDRRVVAVPVSGIKRARRGYLVDYQAGEKSLRIKPIKGAAASGAVAYDKASLPLVLNKPAVLKLGGSNYLLDKEGLYRIRDEANSNVVGQSILYQGDTWRLASHLSRLTVYGNRHKGETAAQWNDRAGRGEPVSLLCGNTTTFVRSHLTAQGVKSRVVQSVAKGNWNNFTDGHYLAEETANSYGFAIKRAPSRSSVPSWIARGNRCTNATISWPPMTA